MVNVLAAPQQHLSANFARRGLAAAWNGVKHHRGPTGSPRIDGVLAALECTVELSYDDAAPLLHWRGSYLPPGRAASA